MVFPVFPVDILLRFYFKTIKKSSIKPNVIILLSDDVGVGDIEVYNSKSKIKTPHLNRMAKNGFRFLDAHSASSKCSPSRYMLLTGRYSLNSGLF